MLSSIHQYLYDAGFLQNDQIHQESMGYLEFPTRRLHSPAKQAHSTEHLRSQGDVNSNIKSKRKYSRFLNKARNIWNKIPEGWNKRRLHDGINNESYLSTTLPTYPSLDEFELHSDIRDETSISSDPVSMTTPTYDIGTFGQASSSILPTNHTLDGFELHGEEDESLIPSEPISVATSTSEVISVVPASTSLAILEYDDDIVI